MTGKLYVVGVGPGDPELLTLKAARILKDVPCIFVPKGREEGSSLALSIVEKALALGDKEIVEIHFPMHKTKGKQEQGGEAPVGLNSKWKQAVTTVYDRLSAGLDAAFITIGDPTIYSTFFYIYDSLIALDAKLEIEIIPGVSSITAAASRAGISLGLGDEKIAILPATYTDDLNEVLEKFDTVVLMKVFRVFDRLLSTLEKMMLADRAIYVCRAGMEGEKVIRSIRGVKEADLNYFSMVIIRK
jgi:precorrin-2/cobalt-factor-2 C20-methyltransferase